MPNRIDNRSGAKHTHHESQLEYMADLIRQLQSMASGRRLKTLALILELAHSEAMQRSRDH